MSASKHNENLYTRVFSKKEKDYDGMMELKYDKILNLINKPLNVLDIGCGNGKLGELIKNKFTDVNITGIDISSDALALAKKKGLNTIRQDIEDTKLKVNNKSFNLIICTDVLEHVCSNYALLKEIHRALDDNGELIVTVPNVNAWYNRILCLAGKLPGHLESTEADVQVTPFVREAIGHVRAFNKDAIIKLLEYSGFKIDKVIGSSLNFNYNFTTKQVAVNKTLIKVFNKADKFLSKMPSIASTIIIKAVKK